MDNENLKDYFSRYPHNDEVYENNGVLFHSRGAADSFGNAQDTKRYTRKDIMLSLDSTVVTEENEEDTRTSAVESVMNLDIANSDYQTLKVLAKDLQLTTEDARKETLIKALTDFKHTLKNE